jgi:hypothetical protein
MSSPQADRAQRQNAQYDRVACMHGAALSRPCLPPADPPPLQASSISEAYSDVHSSFLSDALARGTVSATGSEAVTPVAPMEVLATVTGGGAAEGAAE